MFDREGGGPLKMVLPVVIAAFLMFSTFKVVPPASVALRVSFGEVSDVLSSGVHIVPPWVSMVTFSTKADILEQRNNVPTKEGLNVELDVALMFHVNASAVRDLYLNFGTDFERRLVAPTLSSVSRAITSEAEAKALYTSGRTGVTTQLKHELTAAFQPRGIVLDEVLLKAVALPELVKDAIEQKVKAEQDAARMEFVLAKERQEAERKAVEAKGIAEFQRIVSDGINADLLKWKGIEATEKLAESSNAKMVFVGNSQASMPVLLGGDSL